MDQESLLLQSLEMKEIKDAVNDLLKNRDGLVLGICNGFQALIKVRFSTIW